MSHSDDELHVTITNESQRTVVTIGGDVDMRTAPRLRGQLLDALRRSVGAMLVDLSAVQHIDSSGVGTMVFLKREAERTGRKFVLVGLQPRVRGVFEITNLDRFFRIVGSVNEDGAS